jgi:SAM-dependent methyltransferase
VLLIQNKTLRKIGGVLETISPLGIKLYFKDRAGFNLFPGMVYRNYVYLGGAAPWGSKSLFELFPEFSGGRLVVEHLFGEGIDTPVEELAAMAFVTQAVGPQNIFEIGTFRGRTALNFALNSASDCKIFTMDLSEEERLRMEGFSMADQTIVSKSLTGIDYMNRGVDDKITQLFGNSLTFDFSPYHGQIDLVFVDGAHHFDAVRSDTQNALKMIRPGGVILWHDWGNYGDYNDVIRGVFKEIDPSHIAQIESTQLAFYQAPAA